MINTYVTPQLHKFVLTGITYSTINHLMKRQYCPIQTASLVTNGKGVEVESIEEYYQTLLYVQQHKPSEN